MTTDQTYRYSTWSATDQTYRYGTWSRTDVMTNVNKKWCFRKSAEF